MTGTRVRTAARLGGELAVIVLGVLLALGADRWNQGRLDRASAADYSERLLAELISDSVRLETAREAHSEAVVSGVALLAAVRLANIPDTLSRGLYATAIGNTTLPYRGGVTFQELQNGTSLGLLPAEVRQALFDYYGWVDVTLIRLQDVRLSGRELLIQAGNRSGAWTPPWDPGTFWSHLAAYPDIEDLVNACIAGQAFTASQLNDWIVRLSLLLETLRSAQRGAV